MQQPINFNLEDFKKREKIHQAIEKRAKQLASKNKKSDKKEPTPPPVSN